MSLYMLPVEWHSQNHDPNLKDDGIGDETLDLAAALRSDDTEFGEMGTRSVHQHGALAH